MGPFSQKPYQDAIRSAAKYLTRDRGDGQMDTSSWDSVARGIAIAHDRDHASVIEDVRVASYIVVDSRWAEKNRFAAGIESL